MRVLVVDNYDSFVYNLVQYLAQLGADSVVRRNDAVDLAEIDDVDGVLVSPGPGTPQRAGASMDVIRRCAERERPVLGVCLGHQAIGGGLGGGDRACSRVAARQDVAGSPRRCGRAGRAAQPVHRDPIPLAHDPAGHRARRAGGHRPHRALG